IQEGVEQVHGPPVPIPKIFECNRAEELNRGEIPRMGQALPQIGESEVLPHGLVSDHEPGKVSLHIKEDPGGKAHNKAQRAQYARSPKPPLVVPDPKSQQGQEGESVDIVEPEPDPRYEAR